MAPFSRFGTQRPPDIGTDLRLLRIDQTGLFSDFMFEQSLFFYLGKVFLDGKLAL